MESGSPALQADSLPSESEANCSFLNRNFPGGSDGKASACNVGDLGSVPGLGRSPGEGNGNPLHYSHLENPHGWRILVGYSPWGLKESDTTEPLQFQCVYVNTNLQFIPCPLLTSQNLKLQKCV